MSRLLKDLERGGYLLRRARQLVLSPAPLPGRW